MRRTLFGLFLVVLLAVTAAPALAAPNVSMSARAAYGGRIRSGDGWTTVIVDVTNQGAELSAELLVEPTEGPFAAKSQHVVPLSLPAGQSKRIPIEVEVGGGGNLQVMLQANGKLIATEIVRLTPLPPGALFIGVLSDDELGIPALSLMGAGTAAAPAVARLDAPTFPSQATLLKSFDVIAISRFNSSSLNKAQIQALEMWVGRGGTLLLAGGPEWKRTFTQLPPSLLPVTVTGVGEADLQALGNLVSTPFAGKGPVSTATVIRGRTVLAAGDLPLIVEDRVGTGRVLYQAFDSGLEPVVKWPGQGALYERLLTSQRQEMMQMGKPTGAIESAIQNIPGLALPSSVVLGALLFGYLLLVGPLNYWVLKRFDRREWSWLTVPVVSVGFVAAIYGVGFSKQVTMLRSIITVTELSAGSSMASLTSYVGFYAPTRSQLDIALEGAPLVRPLWQGYGPNGDAAGLAARVVTGDKTRVELLNLNNYSMKGFSMERDVAISGGLTLTDVSFDAGVMRARVINHLDKPVDNAMITAGTAWTAIGRLMPGATSERVAIDLTSGGRGNFQVMPMDNVGVPVGPGQQQFYESERRRNIMAAVFGWDGSQIQPGSVVVAGWTAEPVVDPAVPAIGRETQGANLVYALLPIPVDIAKGDIPPGVVVGVVTAGPNKGRSPFGYSLGPGAHTFRIVLPPLDPARVADLFLHVSMMGGDGTVKLQIKKQATDQWVDLPTTDTQSLPNWRELSGTAGVLELKATVQQHVEMRAPTISVKGVAR